MVVLFVGPQCIVQQRRIQNPSPEDMRD
jgi:hypothetical protein